MASKTTPIEKGKSSSSLASRGKSRRSTVRRGSAPRARKPVKAASTSRVTHVQQKSSQTLGEVMGSQSLPENPSVRADSSSAVQPAQTDAGTSDQARASDPDDPDELLLKMRNPLRQPQELRSGTSRTAGVSLDHLSPGTAAPSRTFPTSHNPSIESPGMNAINQVHRSYQPYLPNDYFSGRETTNGYQQYTLQPTTLHPPLFDQSTAAISYGARLPPSSGCEVVGQRQGIRLNGSAAPSRLLIPQNVHGHHNGTGPASAPQPAAEGLDAMRIRQFVNEYVSEHPTFIKLQQKLQVVSQRQENNSRLLATVVGKLDDLKGSVDEFKGVISHTAQPYHRSGVDFVGDTPVNNVVQFLDEKHDEKVRSALSLSCNPGSSGCTVIEGRKYCPSAVIWAKTLKRPPRKTSGSFLGNFISDLLRDNTSASHEFYPDPDTFFERLFLPSMKCACGELTETQIEHAKLFFQNNREFLESFLRSSLQSVHATRKNELIRKFMELTAAIPAKSYFLTAVAINQGAYRRTESSPVGLPRFLNAVKRAFRISNNERRVTLQQLAFGCISLIRAYTSGSVVPNLYQLVPGGCSTQIDCKEKQQMHGIMCAALAKYLSKAGVRTNDGWDVDNLHVIHIENMQSSWLENYSAALGDTEM